VGGDVPIDSDMLLMTDFINFKIKLTQSFRINHRSNACICVFIDVNMYKYLYLYYISKKILPEKLRLDKHDSFTLTSSG
jgi:hypothetical protein